jgi:3'(2'), 5'-bisphosphate nucleotidase
MNYSYLITAIEAAFQAGLSILEVYHASDDMEVTYKSDNSPLTLADRRAHGIIHKALKTLGLPVLSEEGRSIAYAQRQKWKTFWLVDPLDGTKEFIKRNGEFTVNIALIHKGAPVLGVVYVPVKDKLYFASKDHGAFKFDDYSKSGNRLIEEITEDKLQKLCAAAARLPKPHPDKKIFVVVGSRSHGSAELEVYIRKLKKIHPNLKFISAGSSLKLCLVAEGKADEYPRLGPTMEWDTAAGQAIAECAGAVVLDYDNRQRLRYNKPDLLNPWFIVHRTSAASL